VTPTNPDLSELLVELAATTDMSAEVIKAAVAANPEHREEILRFALEWHAGRDSEDDSDVPPLPAPDLSAFGIVAVVDPFAGKSSTELRQAAEECDIPVSILIKLEQRSIDVETIPLLLLRRLAACLGTGLDGLIGFLSLSPTLSPQTSYRSEKPPKVPGRVSFGSVVQTTGMDDEQRARWLALIE
jgi:hypothetical protein